MRNPTFCIFLPHSFLPSEIDGCVPPKCSQPPSSPISVSGIFSATLSIVVPPWWFSYLPFFFRWHLGLSPFLFLSHSIPVPDGGWGSGKPHQRLIQTIKFVFEYFGPCSRQLQSLLSNKGKAGSEFLAQGARRLPSFLLRFFFYTLPPLRPLCAVESFVSETNVTCIDFCPSLEEVIQFYQANLGLYLLS